MRKVIKIFHPSWDDSIFCKKALEKYKDYEVHIHTGFNFDIEADKIALLEGIDLVVLFPFWWYNPPANFKVWIDELFGWGELKFSKSIVSGHVTVGGGEKRYTQESKYNVEELLNNISLAFEYVNIKWGGFKIDYDCISI